MPDFDPKVILNANTAQEAFMNLSDSIEGLSQQKQLKIMKA